MTATKDGDSEMIVPALRVRQPFGDFFLATLPASLLLEVTFSDIARARRTPGKRTYVPVGVERELDERRRVREIAQFIETSECTIPNSIILSANYEKDEGRVLSQEDPRRWRVVESRPGCCEVVIPTHERIVSIVDGQHRLNGFKLVDSRRVSEIELPCAIFFDLPNPYQAYVFATVNFNQKKVDRSLAYELFGFDIEDEPPEQWPPEKAAVFLARRLNSESDSPFHGHIKLALVEEAPRRAGAPTWMVSTAAVVDGILRLVSQHPKADRSRLFEEGERRTRNNLPDDNAPLRHLYRETNDVLIFTIISNYFRAVQDLFWSRADEESYITRTVGVQATFDVLAIECAPRAMQKKDVSTRFFKDMLAAASDVEFSKDYFKQPSGVGRARIRDELLQRIRGASGPHA